MKKILLLSVFLCSVFMMGFAQETEEKEAIKVKNSDVTNLQLGRELAKYGYENKSAVSLIDAARILAPIKTTDLKTEKIERGAKAEADKTATTNYEPATLLADAKKFAGKDATLLALIEATEKYVKETAVASRGAVGGPQVGCDVVAGNSYIVYFVNFVGGYTAECAVAGGGNTDLDLYIYDQNGNLIVKDVSYSTDCYVRWVPRWTGVFMIKVVNRGSYANSFCIATN